MSRVGIDAQQPRCSAYLAPRRLKKPFFFFLLLAFASLSLTLPLFMLELEGAIEAAAAEEEVVGDVSGTVVKDVADTFDVPEVEKEEKSEAEGAREDPEPMGAGLEMAFGFRAVADAEVAEGVSDKMGSACKFNCSMRGAIGRESEKSSSSSASSSWKVSYNHGAFAAFAAAIDSLLASTDMGGLPLPELKRWYKPALDEEVEDTPNEGELGANIAAICEYP